jgi:F0F1-type ATP synthase membrane subunit c/vacuolar-type H+-ATPase subunit K
MSYFLSDAPKTNLSKPSDLSPIELCRRQLENLKEQRAHESRSQTKVFVFIGFVIAFVLFTTVYLSVKNKDALAEKLVGIIAGLIGGLGTGWVWGFHSGKKQSAQEPSKP